MSEVAEIPSVAEKVEAFTRDVGDYVRSQIPVGMEDKAFAASASALMIALNRQLASCAAAFGETHGVEPDVVLKLVHGQIDRNYRIALDALRNPETVQ